MTEIFIKNMPQLHTVRSVPTSHCAKTIFVRTCVHVNVASSVIRPVCRQRVASEPEQVWPDSRHPRHRWQGELCQVPPHTPSSECKRTCQMTICPTPLSENKIRHSERINITKTNKLRENVSVNALLSRWCD